MIPWAIIDPAVKPTRTRCDSNGGNTIKETTALTDLFSSVPGILVGKTQIPSTAQGGPPLPEAERFPWALSMGVPLLGSVLEGITNRPTPSYKHHYQLVNGLLDQLALRVSLILSMNGKEALPLPASLVIDWSVPRGHLDHRRVAQAAGLGWLGRMGLLVTPEYGAWIRLVTVLVDTEPLLPDGLRVQRMYPLDQGPCGDCVACLTVCPVQAIKRNLSDFDLPACARLVADFGKKLVGLRICGICVKSCKPKRRLEL